MNTRNDLKLYVRKRLTGRWTRPVLVAGICLTADLLRVALLSPFAAAGGMLQQAMGMAVSFILALLSFLLTAGEAHFHLALLRGEDPAVLTMFQVFRRQPDRFLILGFVWLLPELIPSVPGLVPGEGLSGPLPVILAYGLTIFLLVYVRTSLALSMYLLADDPTLGAGMAMRMSAAFMRGRKLSLLFLVLSFTGYFLLGILSAGIGFLFLYPYFHLTLASFYLQVMARVNGQ